MYKPLLIIAFIAFAAPLSAQGLEEVLGNYYKRIGMEKLHQLKNMVTKGTIDQMGMSLPYAVTVTHDGRMYLEVPFQGMVMQRGYDGTVAWMTAPWTGSADPLTLGDFEARLARIQSDFEGMLYDYERKGYSAEFLGKECLEGDTAYLIRLKDTAGDEYTYYIDAGNFVVSKVKGSLNYQGSRIEAETSMSNYKSVDGLFLPFSMESKMDGHTQSIMTVSEYLFNQEIHDSIFIKPAPAPKSE